MSNLEPLLTYTRGSGGFLQQFLIWQDGAPFDLTALPGVVTAIWWLKKDAPETTALQIEWNGTIDGSNNERVGFVVPKGFFTAGDIDYDCNIEIYNDDQLVYHTRPDFITRIENPAGVHTD